MNIQEIILNMYKEIKIILDENNIKYYALGGTFLGAIRHKGFIPWDDDIDIAMLRPDYEKFVDLFSQKSDKSKYFLQNYDSEKEFQPALSRVCIKGTFSDVPAEKHLNICKNVYIDVFPLDNVPDAENDREIQKKDLLKIDRFFEAKLGRIYNTGIFGIKKYAKRILSFSLKIIPYEVLQKRRLDVMKRFEGIQTECVCSTVSQYGYDRQIMNRKIYGIPTLYKFRDTKLYGPQMYDEYLRHLYGNNYMELPPENKRVKPHDAFKL